MPYWQQSRIVEYAMRMEFRSTRQYSRHALYIQALLLTRTEYWTPARCPFGPPPKLQTRQFCRIRVSIVPGHGLGVSDPIGPLLVDTTCVGS